MIVSHARMLARGHSRSPSQWYFLFGIHGKSGLPILALIPNESTPPLAAECPLAVYLPGGNDAMTSQKLVFFGVK